MNCEKFTKPFSRGSWMQDTWGNPELYKTHKN